MYDLLINLILIIVWFICATIIYPWFVKRKIVQTYQDKGFVEKTLKLSHDILLSRLKESLVGPGGILMGALKGPGEVLDIKSIKQDLGATVKGVLNGYFGKMVQEGGLVLDELEEGIENAENYSGSKPVHGSGRPTIPRHAQKMIDKYGEKHPLGIAALEIVMANMPSEDTNRGGYPPSGGSNYQPRQGKGGNY